MLAEWDPILHLGLCEIIAIISQEVQLQNSIRYFLRSLSEIGLSFPSMTGVLKKRLTKLNFTLCQNKNGAAIASNDSRTSENKLD